MATSERTRGSMRDGRGSVHGPERRGHDLPGDAPRDHTCNRRPPGSVPPRRRLDASGFPAGVHACGGGFRGPPRSAGARRGFTPDRRVCAARGKDRVGSAAAVVRRERTRGRQCCGVCRRPAAPSGFPELGGAPAAERSHGGWRGHALSACMGSRVPSCGAAKRRAPTSPCGRHTRACPWSAAHISTHDRVEADGPHACARVGRSRRHSVVRPETLDHSSGRAARRLVGPRTGSNSQRGKVAVWVCQGRVKCSCGLQELSLKSIPQNHDLFYMVRLACSTPAGIDGIICGLVGTQCELCVPNMIAFGGAGAGDCGGMWLPWVWAGAYYGRGVCMSDVSKGMTLHGNLSRDVAGGGVWEVVAITPGNDARPGIGGRGVGMMAL